MFVGHAFIAFALAAAVATWRGWDRERALLLGVVAGGFAAVPDVDILYAVLGLWQAGPGDVWSATAAFWDSSRAVHRAMTHSLVLAFPAAAGFGLVAGRRWRRAAVVPLAGLVALGWAVDGLLAGTMLLLFALAGVGVALGARHLGLDGRTVLLAALVGLLTHPFGDLFTGTPPPLFYPLEPEVFGERVELLTDPTLNLLGVFGLELATIWLGVLVAARLLDWPVVPAIDARASLGALYGVAAFVIPPPTLETSYHFVFSVLAVGSVGAVPTTRGFGRPHLFPRAVTALAAVSFAWAASVVVYGLT